MQEITVSCIISVTNKVTYHTFNFVFMVSPTCNMFVKIIVDNINSTTHSELMDTYIDDAYQLCNLMLAGYNVVAIRPE